MRKIMTNYHVRLSHGGEATKEKKRAFQDNGAKEDKQTLLESMTTKRLIFWAIWRRNLSRYCPFQESEHV